LIEIEEDLDIVGVGLRLTSCFSLDEPKLTSFFLLTIPSLL